VIKELLRNGRKSFVDIANVLNVTETAIRKRVKKMEEGGIIIKYSVEINPRELGFGVKALIGLDTTPQRYLAVIQRLKKNDEILRLYSSSGDHMIMMECWFENDERLNDFQEQLEKIDGVIDICPTIITDLIK
jgi:Lrp/AsnC family transcriptional regulator for asnA, asnC and gidA